MIAPPPLMALTPPTPPHSETELMDRAQFLAGFNLARLAAACHREVPRDLRHAKGWIGELVEELLGATSGSRPMPDFAQLGIELKTIPIGRTGRPKESTQICQVPLTELTDLTWENSLCRGKLARVLWVPVQADPRIPLADRQIGTPILWSPSSAQEDILRRDFEELMDLIRFGNFDELCASLGEALQIRPKAASSRALTEARDADGAPILTVPRGFYLRATFTMEILATSTFPSPYLSTPR